jgi:hypothetical protein
MHYICDPVQICVPYVFARTNPAHQLAILIKQGCHFQPAICFLEDLLITLGKETRLRLVQIGCVRTGIF